MNALGRLTTGNVIQLYTEFQVKNRDFKQKQCGPFNVQSTAIRHLVIHIVASPIFFNIKNLLLVPNKCYLY